MIIDNDGIRCYTDKNNKIVEVGIMNFTTEAKSILERNLKNIKKIYYESPDCFVDFSLLREMENLEEFQMDVRHKTFDVASINLIPKLKEFGSGKFTGELNIETLKRIGYTWHKKSDVSLCLNIEFLFVSNCSDMEIFMPQISKLKKLDTLKFFRISSSSFSKTKVETVVTNLYFSYCPKLEDLNGLSESFGNVTKLEFDHCKNIQDYLPIGKLEKLQELYIYDSGPITDLSFIKNMKNLKLLKIYKTKITDKNIQLLNLIPEVDLLFTGIDIK